MRLLLRLARCRNQSIELVWFLSLSALACAPSAYAQVVPRNPNAVIFELTRQIEDPPNFNWYFRAPNGSFRREDGAHQAMWEPLFLFNYKTGELEPWLAAAPMTPDGSFKNWTLKLRPNVEWSDSTPFTSADVKFTADLVLGKIHPFESFYAAATEARDFVSQVESVSVVDALTAVFHLRGANPRFPLETFGGTRFGSFLIMPKHVWEGKDPTTFKFYPPIGTGPYVLESIDKDHATWKRNDDWWGARLEHGSPFRLLPDPLKLTWKVEDSPSKSQAALNANEIDAARPFSITEFTDAKAHNPKVIGWDPSSALAWNEPCSRQIEINTEHPKTPASADWNPALSNWIDLDPNDANYPVEKAAQVDRASKVRQAISLLVDRAKLVHDAYADTTTPSSTMFSDYGAMKPFIDAVVSANPEYALKPTADPAAADDLLQQAGFTKSAADNFYHDGTGAVLGATLRVDSSIPTDVDAANALSTQLNAAGVKLAVESIPHNPFWGEVVRTGDYEMIYGYMSCGSVGEPYTSMSRYNAEDVTPIGFGSPGYSNTGRWDTPGEKTYSTIVTEFGAMAVGDSHIPPRVAEAYKYLHDEMPFIPIVQSPTIVPFNTTYWVGWPSSGGDTIPMTSWAATMRTIHELTPSKCVRFFRSLPAQINGMEFAVQGGATLPPDSLGQVGLSGHPITISFGSTDRLLSLFLRASSPGKSASITGLSDTGAIVFTSTPAVTQTGSVVSTSAARQLRLNGDQGVALSKVCFAD